MKKIIENVKFMQDGTLVFGDLHLQDGFVERIDYKTAHIDSDLALPGFIDIHTHGFQGISADTCDVEQLHRLAMAYTKKGITSFCPTVSSRPLSAYAALIQAYQTAFAGVYQGARFEGLHLEGPYLQPECCHAIDPAKLQQINIAELEDFLSQYHDSIAIMSIAPELENAMEAIRLLHLYGIEVSLGHTKASYEQTLEAFENGASQITHLGNTMPKIDHRTAGMMDAVFLGDCLCEIIMDGQHMQIPMLRWVIQLLGSKRVCAISDSEYAGLDETDLTIDADTQLHDHTIYQNGKLSRGCRDMLSTFQFLYREMQYDLMDCLAICSLNAAKMLKTLTSEISLGKKVNLVILDQQLCVKDVLINGKSYKRNFE